MIRRILDFVFILIFIWACMIIGLWIIDAVIVPLTLPGIPDGFVTATLKVGISAGLVLFWLWLYREIIRRMFWRIIGTQKRFKESYGNNNSDES